jgi:hypothetical protein
MQVEHRSRLWVPVLLLLSAGWACKSTALNPDGGAKVDGTVGLGGTTNASRVGQTGSAGTGAAGSSGGNGGSGGVSSLTPIGSSSLTWCAVDCFDEPSYRCTGETTYQGFGPVPVPSICTDCGGPLASCSGFRCGSTTDELTCPAGKRCVQKANGAIKDACQPMGSIGSPDGGFGTGGAGQTGGGGSGAAGSSGGKGGSTGSISSGSSSLPSCAVDCFMRPTYKCTSESTYRGYGPVSVPAVCSYCGGQLSRCSGSICQYTTDETSCPPGTRCVESADAGVQGACRPITDGGVDGKDAAQAETRQTDL